MQFFKSTKLTATQISANTTASKLVASAAVLFTTNFVGSEVGTNVEFVVWIGVGGTVNGVGKIDGPLDGEVLGHGVGFCVGKIGEFVGRRLGFHVGRDEGSLEGEREGTQVSGEGCRVGVLPTSDALRAKIPKYKMLLISRNLTCVRQNGGLVRLLELDGCRPYLF